MAPNYRKQFTCYEVKNLSNPNSRVTKADFPYPIEINKDE